MEFFKRVCVIMDYGSEGKVFSIITIIIVIFFLISCLDFHFDGTHSLIRIHW